MENCVRYACSLAYLLLQLLGIGVGSAQAGVLWVGWDGVDIRVVRELVGAGELPAIAALGVDRMDVVGCSTVTKSSWSEQASGLPCSVTGIQSNSVFKPLPLGATVFERAQAAGLPVAVVSGKCNRRELPVDGNMCFGPAMPTAPFANVTPDFLVNVLMSTADAAAACLEAIAVAGDGFVFCHFGQVDSNGHKYGGGSPEYRAALRNLDAALGRLRQAHTGHLLVTSDHGFDIPKLNHGRAPLGIIAASVPLKIRATSRDVFKTLLDLLELPLEAGIPEGASLWKR